MATAVDSGLGRRACLAAPTDIEQIQIRIFVATLLSAMVISISKCSILLFLHQAANGSLQRVFTRMIGILSLLWTIVVMAGIVFQCAMPKPWEIWTGKCIPLVS